MAEHLVPPVLHLRLAAEEAEEHSEEVLLAEVGVDVEKAAGLAKGRGGSGEHLTRGHGFG